MIYTDADRNYITAAAYNLLCLKKIDQAGIKVNNRQMILSNLDVSCDFINNSEFLFSLFKIFFNKAELKEIGILEGKYRMFTGQCFLIEDNRIKKISQYMRKDPRKELFFKAIMRPLKRLTEAYDGDFYWREFPPIADVDLVWDESGDYTYIYLQVQPDAAIEYEIEVKHLISYNKVVENILKHLT